MKNVLYTVMDILRRASNFLGDAEPCSVRCCGAPPPSPRPHGSRAAVTRIPLMLDGSKDMHHKDTILRRGPPLALFAAVFAPAADSEKIKSPPILTAFLL